VAISNRFVREYGPRRLQPLFDPMPYEATSDTDVEPAVSLRAATHGVRQA
jgi:hypothetical protein